MPSGAKKRKAAKKKMEINKPNSSSSSQGNDQESNLEQIRGGIKVEHESDVKIETSCNGGSSNGAKSIEDTVGSSAALKEAVVDRKVDGRVVLDPNDHLLPEKDNNSTLLPNGVEHVKDSGVTEPLLNPSLQPVEQKTSWKGCCGLFEVFMGSDR